MNDNTQIGITEKTSTGGWRQSNATGQDMVTNGRARWPPEVIVSQASKAAARGGTAHPFPLPVTVQGREECAHVGATRF